VADVIGELHERDPSKARVIQTYYSELLQVLVETRRVLKPGRAAIFVVGSSTLRGVDIRVGECLADLGRIAGLLHVGTAVRNIDRDKRMMPASRGKPKSSIESRMHREYVVAFEKE